MTNQGYETMQPSEQLPEREKLPATVYFVASETDDSVLVGMDVQRTGPWMSWFDTVKERRMMAEAILDRNPEHYSFRRAAQEGGHTYTFMPMNLDTYNTSVKPKLFNGKEFPDEQSMISAFLEAKNNAW